MKGYSWRTVAESSANDETAAISLTDYVATENSYRIVIKILARPPIVVRASFHDYQCDDYAVSSAYFAPLIDSVKLL
jgi:hypothetical protein